MDDESGWNDVLVGLWGPRVCDAAVAHVERATIGARCLLLHTLADPDQARPGWVEQLHALVIEAIRRETGADLDGLGSQAAWAAYEQVWDALTARWTDPERLDPVPLRREPRARSLLLQLSTAGAQAAGMDVGTAPPEPLWVAGRLRLDTEGLQAYQALPHVPGAERVIIEELLALMRPASPGA